MIRPDTGVIELKDGEYPFYTQNEDKPTKSGILHFPVGPGSGLDADSTDGFEAVSAYVCGPNKLVATTSDGKLPTSIIATSSSPGTINNTYVPLLLTGTLAYLKANAPSGKAFGIATDQGNAGTLYMYFANVNVGDQGWVLISGS